MSGARWLVLHDLGVAEGAAPWRDAVGAIGRSVVAPDLPGHGGTPPPEGGAYDLLDGAFAAARLLGDAEMGHDSWIVIGVGRSGWSATVLALAGVADVLVLVDGLGDPWLAPEDRIARRRARLHALVDHERDPVEPMGRGEAGVGVRRMDPRLRWPPPPHGDRELVLEAAAALSVPTVIVSTSPVHGPDAELVAAFALSPHRIDVDLDHADPAALVTRIAEVVDRLG